MARGPKKHLKRINAPRAWLLDKMGGIFVTKLFDVDHQT
jgi:small subunit ribosomal protein S4e